MGGTHKQELPPELKLAVLDHATPRSVFTMAAVSTDWREVTVRHPNFFVAVHTSDAPPFNHSGNHYAQTIDRLKDLVCSGTPVSFHLISVERMLSESELKPILDAISAALHLLVELTISIVHIAPHLVHICNALNVPASRLRFFALRSEVLADPGGTNFHCLFHGDARALRTVHFDEISLPTIPVPAFAQVTDVELRGRAQVLDGLNINSHFPKAKRGVFTLTPGHGFAPVLNFANTSFHDLTVRGSQSPYDIEALADTKYLHWQVPSNSMSDISSHWTALATPWKVTIDVYSDSRHRPENPVSGFTGLSVDVTVTSPAGLRSIRKEMTIPFLSTFSEWPLERLFQYSLFANVVELHVDKRMLFKLFQFLTHFPALRTLHIVIEAATPALWRPSILKLDARGAMRSEIPDLTLQFPVLEELHLMPHQQAQPSVSVSLVDLAALGIALFPRSGKQESPRCALYNHGIRWRERTGWNNVKEVFSNIITI